MSEMGRAPRLVYRLLVAVDIEGYSARDARDQLRVQTALGHILDLAAERAGLDRRCWDREVRGDGELAVLPESVDIARAVGGLSAGLDTALAELNRSSRAATPLRLRVALHHGTLTHGPFGPAGDAPVVVSRLLDAAPPRRQLAARREHDLVLTVSDPLYRDVVRTGFCSLDPLGFRAFRVVTKGVTYHGHVYQGRVADTTAGPGPSEPRPNHLTAQGRAVIHRSMCSSHPRRSLRTS